MMYLLNGLPAFFGTINITGNIIISGQGLFANGTNAVPSISFQSDPDTGLYLDAANTLGIATAGAGTVLFSSSAGIGKIKAHGTRVLALEAGTGNTNITLTPSGTGNVVASGPTTFLDTLNFASGASAGLITWGGGYVSLRGASAVGLNLEVNGGSSGSSGIRITSGGRSLFGTNVDSGALLQIGTNTTTSAGGMVFGTDTFAYRTAAGRISFDSTSDPYLNIAKNGTIYGHWVSDASNVYFGSSTGISLILRTNNTTALTLDSSQNATFAGYISTAAAGRITFTGRARLESPVDGVLSLYNAAASDFSRLQFGGTTSSFPALKRSGAAIHVRFADDSAYAAIASGVHVISGSASTVGAGEICYGGSAATTVGATGAASALPALPLGYIIVNVAGTAAKIPYYNS